MPESSEPMEALRVIFSPVDSERSSKELLMAERLRTTPFALTDATDEDGSRLLDMGLEVGEFPLLRSPGTEVLEGSLMPLKLYFRLPQFCKFKFFITYRGCR